MKASTALSLIAEWPVDKDFTPDRPDRVYWGDNTPANHEDYLAHQDCTYIIEHQGSRLVKHIFPWIVADVQYDNDSGRWRVSGHEVEPFYLELFDRDVADEQITAEMSSYRAVYKHRILRG